MDFLDDEAGESQDDVLVPSSQRGPASSQSIRPSKRRRLNNMPSSSGSEESGDPDTYDLPSNDMEQAEEEEIGNQKSKYDQVLYEPVRVESQQDEFVTQVEQPWSSPSAIRGPRWRKKSPTPELLHPVQPLQTRPRNLTTSFPAPTTKVIVDHADEFDDDDDADMLEALLANEDLENITAQPISTISQSTTTVRAQAKTMRQTTLFGVDTTQRTLPRATQSRTHNWPMANRNEAPTHHKIDLEAMKTWTYPTNVGSIRDYQFNIVHRALFHNILVALPTGLGKTFIAATVMLNYYRWTTESQIVFVAPTKPLVTQQVDACFNIAGIPRSQTTLLTGEIQPGIRAEEWQEKRVFFMTPQTLINDLKTGMADPKKIVLLVVDEAHKATGNYAYVEVVRFLRRFNSSFRVLALTATPGAHVEAVQKVIDGLDIARVEIRTEESMDIRAFVHSRETELEFFDNSPEIEMCLELFATAVRPVLSKINGLNAYFSNDPKTITLYGLLKAQQTWSKSDAGRNANWGVKGMVQSCFKPLMSLAHNLELLKFHGIGPFYHKMKIFDEECHGSGKYAKQIAESDSFRKLMNRLRGWVNTEDFVGHPKLSYLNTVVLNHFLDAGGDTGFATSRPPSDTRIMIFAHYRDSAEEIVRVLNRHVPMIRPHVFVGQSGTKGSEGMDQKSQIDIIKKFKAGIYNTLVATSIGEEGLDIGEVDLIVCYDCSKSPIRMLQRMGRTGRKRAGKIVLLLMRGKEEKDYYAAKDNYLKMQEIIENGTQFQYHDDRSPRIVPREIQPVVDKRHVDIPVENTQAGIPEPNKRKTKNPKRPPKKFHMPDGVETGFSFLGNGKRKETQKRLKELSPEPELDIDIAVLPPLNNALLTTQDEEELERRFVQVPGSQTVYIEAIQLDSNPQELYRLAKTRLVKHSKLTKSLIKASKIMREKTKDWSRPAESMIITRFGKLSGADEETMPEYNARKRLRHSPRSSKTTSTSKARSPEETDENEYDMNDDFINDNPSSSAHVQSSSPAPYPQRRNNNTRANTSIPNQVINEQDNPINSDDDNDDDDLPDMNVIFSTRNPNPNPKPKSMIDENHEILERVEGQQAAKAKEKATKNWDGSRDGSRSRNRRNVISDDEDEEDEDDEDGDGFG